MKSINLLFKELTSASKPHILSAMMLLFLSISFQSAMAQTLCTNPNRSSFIGTNDGFRYELWNQYGQGTGCMTLNGGALFSGEWEDVNNYLARRGLGYDKTMHHDEIGVFHADYNCDYNPNSEKGNSYLSVYGWTVDPLIEYYIIEDWRNWIPSMAQDAVLIDSIEINGSVYDILKNLRVDKPSILGDTTFYQYFSIRRDVRNSGTIDISEHFKKWESLDLEMGKMFEVSFVVEGYQSKGDFDFTELNITDGNTSTFFNHKGKKQELTIFPNPSYGEVTIQLGSSDLNGTICITDTSGKTVYSHAYHNKTTLEINNLKSGIYLVSQVQNGTRKYGKIIVY